MEMANGGLDMSGIVRSESADDIPSNTKIYIRPGCTEDLTYRKTTFIDFPPNVVDTNTLASKGFYFTGYKDRVKCFCCGKENEGWEPSDDPGGDQCHYPGCAFMNGSFTSNVSQGGLTFNQRIGANIPLDDQIEALSANMGNLGITAIFDLQPWPKTDSSFAANNLIQKNMTLDERMAAYPCNHPINASMRTEESRLQTFLDHITSWPAHRISATPQEMVKAGFYYLGERDKVKCWYCDGGLENWKRDDDPWERHIKRCPKCEYVLQQTGPTSFMKRSIDETTAGSPPKRPRSNGSLIGGVDYEEEDHGREEDHGVEAFIFMKIKTSPSIAFAETMGYPKEKIEEVMRRRFRQHRPMFSTRMELVDALLELEEEEEKQVTGETLSSSIDEEEREIDEQNKQIGPSSSMKRPSSEANPFTSPKRTKRQPRQDEETSSSRGEDVDADDSLEKGVKEELSLEEEQNEEVMSSSSGGMGGFICRVCRKEKPQLVFFPCNHAICCASCGEKCRSCPACSIEVGYRMCLQLTH